MKYEAKNPCLQNYINPFPIIHASYLENKNNNNCLIIVVFCGNREL